jgi:MYXO-CTERM domain-containing protein
MKIRWTHGLTALHGIALALTLTSLASAQTAPDDGDEPSDEQADCMPSRAPHECSDRCPDYDTCFVSDEARLFYQVGDERFDCDGLDCAAASVTLGDYCCRRGEYAPASDGGGGCTVAAETADVSLGGGAAALGALVAFASWRKRRTTARSERPLR